MADEHAHERLINDFYTGFAATDAEAMVRCYHPDIFFSDPVFPELRGEHAGGMWRMLCSRAKDLEIIHSQVKVDDAGGSAHWDANYTFGATGRMVHNRIDAKFRFKDGLIIEHRDHFDFWRWSRMALGPIGIVLGWTPMVRGKVRSQAAGQLERFLAKR